MSLSQGPPLACLQAKRAYHLHTDPLVSYILWLSLGDGWVIFFSFFLNFFFLFFFLFIYFFQAHPPFRDLLARCWYISLLKISQSGPSVGSFESVYLFGAGLFVKKSKLIKISFSGTLAHLLLSSFFFLFFLFFFFIFFFFLIFFSVFFLSFPIYINKALVL